MGCTKNTCVTEKGNAVSMEHSFQDRRKHIYIATVDRLIQLVT